MENRLDHVLLQQARRGVQIVILLWNETKLAFAYNNNNAKAVLESLHPNIRVSTFPSSTGPLTWSNHEKIVIVDQTVAFVGALPMRSVGPSTREQRAPRPPTPQAR